MHYKDKNRSIRYVLIGLLSLLGCGGEDESPGWGQYEGRIVAEWDPSGREMFLEEDFTYTDAYGRKWVAPAGSIIDGASIPKIFWSKIGSPLEGKYRAASVVHDVACQERTAKWQDVHRMFYRAMRCSGVSDRKAKLMYTAVYMGGPRWVDPSVVESTPKLQIVKTPTLSEFAEVKEFIEEEDPSLKEIREVIQEEVE